MRTRSPTLLALDSSCAFSRLDRVITRSYRGWRNTRSMRTTRVFVILSLTTTPSRVFVSAIPVFLCGPADVQGTLSQGGLGPGEVALGLADARRVLRHPHRQLEPQVEELL